MRLSKKAECGTRVVLELAANYGKGVVPLSDIAAKEGISVKYLEQVMMTLRRAGFVMATRGALGGYSLKRPPWEIRMGELLRVLEERLEPTECSRQDPSCHRSGKCRARPLWVHLSQAVQKALDSMTLQDLLEGKVPLSHPAFE